MKAQAVWLIALCTVHSLAFAIPARASALEDPYDGTWHFAITPYLWAPRIDGTLNFTTGNGSKPTVSITPIDYLDNLNVPIMITGEVRKGPWSAVTDLVWVDFSGEKAVVESITGPGGRVEIPIDLGTTTGLQGTIWNLGGGYTVWRNSVLTVDVLGGFRYFHVETSLDWQLAAGVGDLPRSGSTSESENLWNGIIGVRGRVRFGGGRWLVPYYLDVGTGSSEVTWLGLAGLGYAFGWGDVLLAYRDLGFNADDSSLIEQLRLSGPAVGVAIHF